VIVYYVSQFVPENPFPQLQKQVLVPVFRVGIPPF
jgi:hypothetical protein